VKAHTDVKIQLKIFKYKHIGTVVGPRTPEMRIAEPRSHKLIARLALVLTDFCLLKSLLATKKATLSSFRLFPGMLGGNWNLLARIRFS
jgi:hypothetical protein